VQRWLLSGLQTDGGFSDAAICAGLDVAANLKIAATSGGRANRPYQKLSTGAPKKAKPTPAHYTPTRHRYKPNTELKNRANFPPVAPTPKRIIGMIMDINLTQ
jgi:hypothetical protein